MDGFTLDALLPEARSLVIGRHVDRVALGGGEALHLETAGRSRLCVRLDVTRATPGLYVLSRDEMRALRAPLRDPRGGAARHALLLFRKHIEGRRVDALARVPGTRFVTLEFADGVLVLRLTGAPSITLVLGGRPIASLGSPPPAFPVPAPAWEREWDRIAPSALEDAVGKGPRALLDLCPGLGPTLARRLVAGEETVESLRRHLVAPRPTVVTDAPLAEITDARLAEPGSVLLLPFPPDSSSATQSPESPRDAARLFLAARQRGAAFAEHRKAALDRARREVRRLRALEAHLEGDQTGLPEEGMMRRWAEALLAAPVGAVDRGSSSIRVPDPLSPGDSFTLRVDPSLSVPANADRLFAKARRVGQAREQIAARLLAIRPALLQAIADEQRALSATTLAEVAVRSPAPERKSPQPGAGDQGTRRPRHYLTSRGLSIRVGRGARENQQLTFGLARPEDFWLHARDVPGAHVILQDVGGRAGPQDLREAAELAAFFSDARGEAGVDVHVTRRKHVRPGGGAGRVKIGHSETLRVAPRDPADRLRVR